MKALFYYTHRAFVEVRMKTMLTIQGFFYLLTGMWPLISMTSFMMVTGPKKDIWPVKTVGIIISCSGLVFLYTGLVNPMVPVETLLLAVINGLGLAAVDLHYVRKGIIRRVYLLDAGVEILMAAFYLTRFPW